MTYFFYNGMSWLIADNHMINGTKLLDNADNAANFISSSMKDDEMMLLAYDGETFGHHHKFADLWAQYLPKAVENIDGMRYITIPEYLKEHKPESYTDIFDNSSWSCHCGNLSRWTDGCDCAGGGKTYQRPLYDALNEVEDVVHETFIATSKKYFVDPWAARNDYIDIKIGNMTWDGFFKKHLRQKASRETKDGLKYLLDAEYSVQLSFTSCGWFFSEFGIQTARSIIDGYNALVLASHANPYVIEKIPEYCGSISKSDDIVHDSDGKISYKNGLDELMRYIRTRK